MHDEPVMPMKIAIFGTDSLLAAHPVNWVQLTHACRKAGFDFLVPVSWGEELIAAHVGRQMADSATTSVMSSCPLVAERLRIVTVPFIAGSQKYGATLKFQSLASLPFSSRFGSGARCSRGLGSK